LGAAAKVRRVVEFLLGLRDERVAATLAGCGFMTTERAKGWLLLQALGMANVARDVRQDSDLQSKLDAWHNHWFRVAKVSLQHDFPRVYDQIFSDLNQMPRRQHSHPPQRVSRTLGCQYGAFWAISPGVRTSTHSVCLYDKSKSKAAPRFPLYLHDEQFESASN
jgi:hypothetical protein